MMTDEIEEYDERGNLTYFKWKDMERWSEYDENNNLVHYRSITGSESWYEYDENNNKIYQRSGSGAEFWYKYDENKEEINITKEKLKERAEKEFLSRTPVGRFELMEI